MRLPVRWLAIGAVAGLFAACPPSLKEGRAYRCTPGGDTAQCDPWLCRLDGYCHDPAVGEPLDCAVDSDCGGGWFCGKDGTCHDPAVPADLTCDTDAQCAGGWRCNTEGRCVDPGPASFTPVGYVEQLVLLSPLGTSAELLSAGPAVIGPDGVLRETIVGVTGTTLRVSSQTVRFSGGVVSYGQDSGVFETPFEFTDIAVSWPVFAGTLRNGGSSIVILGRGDGGSTTARDFPSPTPFRPMAVAQPDDGQRPIAALDGTAIQVVGMYADAGTFSFDAWRRVGGAYVDVASTGWQPDGGASLDIPLLVVTGSQLVMVRPNGADPYDSVAWEFGGESEPSVTYRPIAARATSDGFAIAFSRRLQGGREFGTFVSVSPWDLSTGSPVPPATLTASDAGTSRAYVATLELACPEGETLKDFAVVSSDTPTSVAAEVLCMDDTTKRHRVYQNSRPVRDLGRGVADGRTSGTHAWLSERGQLAVGESIDAPLEFSLFVDPDWVSATTEGNVMAGVDRTTYSGTYEGLVAAFTAIVPNWTIERLVETSQTTALFREGVVVRFPSIGEGDGESLFLLEGLRSSNATSGAWLFDQPGGEDFVGGVGDAVFAGFRENDLSLAFPTTRPAPGFDITSLDVVPVTDGGAYDAWAIANRRLFALTARTVERWSSTELPLTNLEPLSTWYEGGRAYVGTSTGQVLVLPERVPTSEALGEGIASLVGTCGTAVALKDGFLFQLGPSTDGGLRPWLPLDPPVLVPLEDGGIEWRSDAGREPEAGRLYRFRGRAWVASTTGMLYELGLAGCPP